MLLNNNHNCCTKNIDDCNYEPTGINAQFGYNSANLFNNASSDRMCCKERDEIGEKMLSEIRCLMFAVTDISQYLNTHPDDKKASCLHREYCQQLKDLSDKYQKIYGPLSIYFPCNSWRWLEGPWPWEGSEL